MTQQATFDLDRGDVLATADERIFSPRVQPSLGQRST